MANTYIYPHVSISKFAKTKTRVTPVDDSAPVMLSLFTSTKGPENQFVKAYTYEDFTKTYGSTVFNKSATNPEFLCTANWLNNGGAVLAYRMVGDDEQSAKVTLPASLSNNNAGVLFTAKNSGSYYNGFSLKLSYNPMGNYLYMTVLNASKEEVEGFSITKNNMDNIFESSEFINITDEGMKFIQYVFDAAFEKNNITILIPTETRFDLPYISGVINGNMCLILGTHNLSYKDSICIGGLNVLNDSELSTPVINLTPTNEIYISSYIYSFNEIIEEFKRWNKNEIDNKLGDDFDFDAFIKKKYDNLNLFDDISECAFIATSKTKIYAPTDPNYKNNTTDLGGKKRFTPISGIKYNDIINKYFTDEQIKEFIIGKITDEENLIGPEETNIEKCYLIKTIYGENSNLNPLYLENYIDIYSKVEGPGDSLEFENLIDDKKNYGNFIGQYPNTYTPDKSTAYPIIYYPSSKYYQMFLNDACDENKTINVIDAENETHSDVVNYVLFREENGQAKPALETWKDSVITYNEALILSAIGDMQEVDVNGTKNKAVYFKYFDSDANKHEIFIGKIDEMSVGNDDIEKDITFENANSLAKGFISYLVFSTKTQNSPLFTIKSELKKTLEYPIDVFFDGQYNPFVKKAIMANLATLRADCHFFFNVFYGDIDAPEMRLTLDGKTAANDMFLVGSEEGDAMYRNVSVYSQAAVITNSFTGKEQWVGPTYFLSYMTMDVDNKYGIQYPVAGLTRGTLNGVTKITGTPNNDLKNELYLSKINYIEKDTRGYKFMCQLTRDVANTGTQYTALSYVNNSRTTERIARELEKIGRDYLFEFNDTTTLNNMQETLNAYLIAWVQNRTLSMAECFVKKNQYNENAVDISMNIKFNGTIEIISIDITID